MTTSIITQVTPEQQPPARKTAYDRITKYKRKLLKHKSTTSLAEKKSSATHVPIPPVPSLPPNIQPKKEAGFLQKGWNWLLCCIPEKPAKKPLSTGALPVIQSTVVQDTTKTEENKPPVTTNTLSTKSSSTNVRSFFPSRSAASLPKPVSCL